MSIRTPTHVSFHVSPDQKWIYESLSYGSRMNGAQLFKCKDGLKFDPLQRDFEEAVWEFFGKEEPPVAIWSLILAVLSFTCGWLFTAIPAVICGHIARAKIRKSDGALGGRGIATAGLVLGYIALLLGIMGIRCLSVSSSRIANGYNDFPLSERKLRLTMPK